MRSARGAPRSRTRSWAPRSAACRRPSARRRALELLDKVGLKGFENAYPKALSHGMRQRVALARTFSLDAPILLMDEPFGALDAQTKLQLEDVLLSLWQREQRTVVFVTHDLSEAVSMSDRVVVMSARPGRIIADVRITLGRPRSVRALQKDPAYHELYSHVWTKLEEGLLAVTDRTTTWTTPQLWAGRAAILAVFFLLWEQAAATQAHRPDPDRPAERHRRVSLAGDLRHRQPDQGPRLDHARHHPRLRAGKRVRRAASAWCSSPGRPSRRC